MTASLFAWFLFSAYARGKQRLGLQVMAVLSILSLVLFVRNGYGVMFLVGFIILTVVVLALTPKWLRDFYYLLLAFLCLEESVFGPASLDRICVAKQSEAQVMRVIWPIIQEFLRSCGRSGFTLFALWCAKQAVSAFLGRSKSARRASRTYYDGILSRLMAEQSCRPVGCIPGRTMLEYLC